MFFYPFCRRLEKSKVRETKKSVNYEEDSSDEDEEDSSDNDEEEQEQEQEEFEGIEKEEQQQQKEDSSAKVESAPKAIRKTPLSKSKSVVSSG